ncbi:hypothetical protein COEREDRAFT_80721, partial [Coemansia reversa NRRL 1564]
PPTHTQCCVTFTPRLKKKYTCIIAVPGSAPTLPPMHTLRRQNNTCAPVICTSSIYIANNARSLVPEFSGLFMPIP